jgi:hypothetical protein
VPTIITILSAHLGSENSMRPPRFRALVAVLLAILVSATALTQTPAPAPPPQFDVQLRYHVEAARNDRVRQYKELLKSLKQIGFVLDTTKVEESDPEDVRATRLFGTISSDKAGQLVELRNIRTVLLTPSDAKLPADKATLARVQLSLAPMPTREAQRQLSEQMRQVLGSLGFKEGVSYDHRGYTRMVGSIPAGQLETLLNSVRLVPSGWSLIQSSFLADLRKHPGGGDLLETILYDWSKNPAGKKEIDVAVQDWRGEPAAKKYIASLPLNPNDRIDASVIQEQLMVQMAHHADAREVLQSLLARVLRNEKAPELIALLLRRVNVHAANSELPVLYRTVAPLRAIEVQGIPAPEARPPAPEAPEGQERIDPELRELLKDAAKKTQPMRLEVLLAQTPDAEDRTWRSALTTGTDMQIEGRLGSLVTVLGPLGDATKLAARPEVVGVRLPRLGRSRYQTLNPDDKPPSAMQITGLVQLHDKGHRGKGARVAVIDSDFRGWEKSVLDGKLPAKTRLLDITRERNRTFEPDPYPNDAAVVGFGTRNAINTARAAPEAELILIRIDAAAPYMLQNVASAINCDSYHSMGLDQRHRDLEVDRQQLANRFDALMRDRRQVLDNYSEDFGKDVESKKARDTYQANLKQYEDDDRAFDKRVAIMLKYRQDLDDLKKVRIVSSGLIWNDGHPVDGASALSRYFDDQPFKAGLWFQATGDTRGQAWSGLFRDTDGNGVMEFAPADARLPKGAWTNELNFLGWQTGKEGESLDLPANAKLRFSLQWREAHDPLFADAGKDVYRDPLANLRLVLVYQPDPEGKKQPADDVQVIAESSGLPLRLEVAANAATYEQTLTYTVTKPGRYALRIEGRIPANTRPAEYPTLPAAVKSFELRPRLFLETLDGPGRAVLRTYRTEAGTIGMPGDAQNVITIGADGAR